MTFGKQQAALPLILITLLFAGPVAAAKKAPSLTPAQRSALQRRAAAGKAADKQAIVKAALRQRGTRYVWGGASRGGFDCSGLITWLFRTQRGIALPRTASAQARKGVHVPFNQLKPGDLLFFSTYRRGICHVGVFVGNGKFVHAANRRKGVRVDSLTGYYARRFKTARRV